MVINPLPTHHYVNGQVDHESINNFWSSRLRLLPKSKRKPHLQMLKKNKIKCLHTALMVLSKHL